MFTLRSLTAMAVMLTATVASADDKKADDKQKVDNPVFTSWSKCAVGASVKSKMTSNSKGTKSTVTYVVKLLEMKADQLTIEISAEVEVMGKVEKPSPQQTVIPKLIEVSTAEAEAIKAGKPLGSYEDGSETVKIGTQDVKTKWFKHKNKMDGVELSGQTWLSDDMPGMTVKFVLKTPDLESTLEVIEFTKK